jgi:hypothetical protein
MKVYVLLGFTDEGEYVDERYLGVYRTARAAKEHAHTQWLHDIDGAMEWARLNSAVEQYELGFVDNGTETSLVIREETVVGSPNSSDIWVNF